MIIVSQWHPLALSFIHITNAYMTFSTLGQSYYSVHAPTPGAILLAMLQRDRVGHMSRQKKAGRPRSGSWCIYRSNPIMCQCCKESRVWPTGATGSQVAHSVAAGAIYRSNPIMCQYCIESRILLTGTIGSQVAHSVAEHASRACRRHLQLWPVQSDGGQLARSGVAGSRHPLRRSRPGTTMVAATRGTHLASHAADRRLEGCQGRSFPVLPTIPPLQDFLHSMHSMHSIHSAPIMVFPPFRPCKAPCAVYIVCKEHTVLPRAHHQSACARHPAQHTQHT